MMKAETENKTTTEDRTCTIATKIPLSYKARLANIAEAFNMKYYSILQALIYSFIAYTDRTAPLTEEHITLMKTFCPLFLRAEYNPLSNKNAEAKSATEAIMFCQCEQHTEPVYVTTEANGAHKETLNHDTMLSALLKVIAPDILKDLQAEARQQNNFSITQTLREVLTEYSAKSDQIASDIAEMFTDIRIGSGDKINEDIFYKRARNNSEAQNIIPRSKYRRADF